MSYFSVDSPWVPKGTIDITNAIGSKGATIKKTWDSFIMGTNELNTVYLVTDGNYVI